MTNTAAARVTYTELVRSNFDAGVYRAYMAHKYGLALEFGMSVATYGRAIEDAKHLARLMGLVPNEAAVRQIFDTATADYAIIDPA